LPHPFHELDRDGLVHPKSFSHLCHLVGWSLRAGHHGSRIAGSQPQQEEGENSYNK
jgi:hypothetical protein